VQSITIAIDGYSSTGKSTVAKQLAKALGYLYVDSGAMYRAVTLYAIEHGFISESNFHVNDFIDALDKVKLDFRFNEVLGHSEILLNGKLVEKEIRSMEVSNFVSMISTIPEVRSLLVKQQRNMRKNNGIVMDGRDIGTVVFPKAELKIFLTASSEVRAKRRYDELIGRSEQVDYEEVLHNVKERDYIDSHREESPLEKASDAIEIDNTNLSLKEQFKKILRLAVMAIEDTE
jgi:cytidylate kinase